MAEPTESTTPINGSGSTTSTNTLENINVDPNLVSTQDTPGLQHQQRPDTKIVVVMNANARGVSNQTIQMAQDVFGIESVLVTHTIPDVYRALQPLIVTKPFQPNTTTDHLDCHPSMIIVTMGGDGTLATTIQTMCQILLEQSNVILDPNNNNNNSIPPISSSSSSYTRIMSQLPIIAYVPLGTGNAVGSVVGCSYHSDNSSSARNSASQSSTAEKSSTMSTTTTSPSSSNIVAQLYHRIQSVFHFVLHQLRRWFQSRSSLQRLRWTLQHILSATTTNSTLPITELPMLEISNNNFTDLCFFAGGTSVSKSLQVFC
jgi:nitrate reductase NapAB chaperone NapD